ncbi:tRNA1(Val) (adenine(37)-N6)-methyltransferase [Lacinutrix sp. 5H-3-7-4]|uniref:tRNA1(Val) (adenine(37)-N6)-methyltransferase n=1 Tax=Lacinutrix sp. (strain 5H-3-7-4) TaxID=983544 RepID=UPI00020A39A0|nr:methyltransferase [Lacinutrix sp. 5H-3-7-4]AEH01152.1 tRNA (adenine-N(6)-)-methyltransferase [Lacinutrix sp. 5H-3-7-4]
MSKPFDFKQFTVKQDQCAMKIGTDGVLLGAWATLTKQPLATLDIGAGTGVLSLMLAQRSHAEVIDALEIDESAYEQCVENFEASPWSDRLFCYHADLAEFTEEIEDKYDLIICNPPFYSEDYKTENTQRDLARFQDAMPFEHLVDSVSKLLMEDGTFCTVIPFKEEDKFIDLASAVNLMPNKITRVRGTLNSEIKRSLIEMSFRESAIEINELIIENARHDYTEDYKNLTKSFYLKM